MSHRHSDRPVKLAPAGTGSGNGAMSVSRSAQPSAESDLSASAQVAACAGQQHGLCGLVTHCASSVGGVTAHAHDRGPRPGPWDGGTTSRALVETCLARIADRTAKARAPSSRSMPSRHVRWRTRWTRCAASDANPSRFAGIPDQREGSVRYRRRSRRRRARACWPMRRPRAAHRAVGAAPACPGFVPARRTNMTDSPFPVSASIRTTARRLALGPRGRAHSRRQFLGHRGVCRRRHGDRRIGHGYRRFVPHSRGVLRRCRLQADRAPSADHGGAAAGAQPQFRGTARAECRVLRGDRCHPGRRGAACRRRRPL